MLQNSCRQYPSVPALRPNLNLVEETCSSHHVSACNGFNNTSAAAAAVTTSSSSPHPSPPPLPPLSAATNTSSEANGARSCTVCGATKTPLWRSGPQGPKSLCNACGIRARKMHERQYRFAAQHPPQASASCTWMVPSEGAISDGSAYGRKAWNGDMAGGNHGHHIRTNLHCEDGDDDDDCADNGDGGDSLAMAMPSAASSSSPSQHVSIKHCPSVRSLSFKRRAPRSPSSAPPRPCPKPWQTIVSSIFSFSRDDEQAALLLMALSHGLTLSK